MEEGGRMRRKGGALGTLGAMLGQGEKDPPEIGPDL